MRSSASSSSSSTTITRMRSKLWLFLLTWPLVATTTTTLASNVSVQNKQSHLQQQQQQQQHDGSSIQQQDEDKIESNNNKSPYRYEQRRHSFNTNTNIVTTFTPIIPKTTLINAATITSAASLASTSPLPSLALIRKKNKITSFPKQVDLSQSSLSSSSSYTFTSLSELFLHVLSSKNAHYHNTAFAQRLKQQEEANNQEEEQQHVVLQQSGLEAAEAATTQEPATIIATTTTRRQHYLSLWQPVFGSVIGIIFASAFMTNPSVIWSEIWQTATQILAVHGLYRLVAVGIGRQQKYGSSWMKKAALLVLQLVYTNFFQIPSHVHSYSQYSPSILVPPQPLTGRGRRFMSSAFWQNTLGAITPTISSISAASGAAAVFIAQTVRRMVVNEVWTRFWKGTWMNQVILNTIYYNNLFFPTPTTSSSSGKKQKEGQGEEMRDDSWLHQVQDFMSDAIQRGSGKLIQGLVQKHVMQVTSAWIQHGGAAFVQQAWQNSVMAMVSLFCSSFT